VNIIEGAGFTLVLLFLSAYYLKNIWKRRRLFLDQAFICGVKPLPVILVVGIFTGMILALQIGVELQEFGIKESISRIIGKALCRELGPFMTALILTASVGSGMAAEIGTMKVSEEIDALEVMSIDPIDFLAAPRILALAIMCPILTLVTNFMGVIGGALVGKTQLQISLNVYFDAVFESLAGDPDFFGLPKDLYTGLFKAYIFGTVVAAVGCSSGLRAEGGALGVGQATRNAVIKSFLLIIILGYYMTWLFYR
jgi:phospholipid/cholesterol/gamma-HCH transport system permease protein